MDWLVVLGKVIGILISILFALSMAFGMVWAVAHMWKFVFLGTW